MLPLHENEVLTLKNLMDSRLPGHVCKGTIAVVVKKVSTLTLRMIAIIQYIRRDIDIEPPIAIIIAERSHDACILDVQTIDMSHFFKCSITLINI